MSIQSHSIFEQTTQAGGVQRVQVLFIDHLKGEHRRQFDFPKEIDIDKAILERYSGLEQGLKEQEIDAVCAGVCAGKAIPQLSFSTYEDIKTYLIDKKTSLEDNISGVNVEKVRLEDKIDDITTMGVK